MHTVCSLHISSTSLANIWRRGCSTTPVASFYLNFQAPHHNNTQQQNVKKVLTLYILLLPLFIRISSISLWIPLIPHFSAPYKLYIYIAVCRYTLRYMFSNMIRTRWSERKKWQQRSIIITCIYLLVFYTRQYMLSITSSILTGIIYPTYFSKAISLYMWWCGHITPFFCRSNPPSHLPPLCATLEAIIAKRMFKLTTKRWWLPECVYVVEWVYETTTMATPPLYPTITTTKLLFTICNNILNASDFYRCMDSHIF